MTDSPDQTPEQLPDELPDQLPDGAAAELVLTLQQFPEKLAVVHLPVGAEVPAWAESSSIFSITATATETSLVCAGRNVPTKVVATRGLIGFALAGPLDPSSVGVLVALLAPLAEVDLSVFTLSTHETVWVLVPAPAVDTATEAWRRQGYAVEPAVPLPSRKS